MTTTTLTDSETPTRHPAPRPRTRYLFATAILGLASVGAVALTTVGGDSPSRAPNPVPVTSQPISSTETFPGCLNDIECNGEPSPLPPGFWDLPSAPSVD